jgi:hypothetical protein
MGYEFNEYEITSKKNYLSIGYGDYIYRCTLNNNEFKLSASYSGGISSGISFNLDNNAYLQDHELPCSLIYNEVENLFDRNLYSFMVSPLQTEGGGGT